METPDINLNKEAEEYAVKKHNHNFDNHFNEIETASIQDYMAGAVMSKYVKYKILKGKIEVLMWINPRCDFDNSMKEVIAEEIKELKEELEHLSNQ